MAVGRGLLRSYNLVNILYIYLIFGGITIKNNTRKHTEGNLAIIFISKELASQKPQYNENLRRSMVKRKYLTTSTKLLIGMRIFINFSLVAILIRLSGDVETNPGPFNFEVKECRTRGLKVCHLNMRSLLPKIDSLRLFVSKNPFDVIALSETWLKPSTTDAEIDIPNYSMTRNDRTDQTGGERHFMFAMVYRYAHAGICKAVTLRPVGLKSYVLKQSPCLFVQPIDHQILTFKLSLKNSETICLKSKKVPKSSYWGISMSTTN